MEKTSKLVKKTSKLGDKLKQKLAPKEFGRIAASTAKQVITQRLREKEKDSAYPHFEYRNRRERKVCSQLFKFIE